MLLFWVQLEPKHAIVHLSEGQQHVQVLGLGRVIPHDRNQFMDIPEYNSYIWSRVVPLPILV